MTHSWHELSTGAIPLPTLARRLRLVARRLSSRGWLWPAALTAVDAWDVHRGYDGITLDIDVRKQAGRKAHLREVRKFQEHLTASMAALLLSTAMEH